MMEEDPLEFEVDRDRLENYHRGVTLFVPLVFPFIFPLGFFFGIGFILAAIWWFKFDRPYSHARAMTFHCWIDRGQVLRVNSGTIFRQSLSLPLDRITSITLSQGPLMNWYGVSALDIKTDGGFPTINPIRLIGLKSPEKVRGILLDERRKALHEIQAERFA